ncbi:MAG: hypothetical protein ACJ754_06795 [Pyrinomonadaceae bacterium]
MKRLFLLLACIVLPAVTASAQTAPAPTPEKVLEIHRFNWYEASVMPIGEYDDYFPGKPPSLNYQYRYENRSGRDDYGVTFVLKNVSRKPIKSVNLGFVFRDAETDRVFLTYHLRFDQRIGPGEKKELRHTIKEGQEPNNFSPAAPSEALLEYTKRCGDHTLVMEMKSGKLVKRKVRAGEEPVRNLCFAQPAVTRVEYEDGTFWQP